MRLELTIARNNMEEEIKLISSDHDYLLNCTGELLETLSTLTKDAKSPIINRMIEELKKFKWLKLILNYSFFLLYCPFKFFRLIVEMILYDNWIRKYPSRRFSWLSILHQVSYKTILNMQFNIKYRKW